MTYFFDTSVLVAATSVHDIHHAPSYAAYLAATRKNSSCAAHSLGEVYATLTRLPGKQGLSCEQALLFVEDIKNRLTIIALDEDEYFAVIRDAVTQGIVGGTIYDLLIARCALKGGNRVIYTWNVAHFLRLGEAIAKRARTPGEI